jgi:ribokinase
VVVGSTMTDMITYADALPAAGETVIGDSFALGFGGKGANQAVMCALLGASVRFVGCLGQDVFGEMTLENLRSFGIDTSSITVTGAAASGAAPIWVDASGENRIIVAPGANGLLDPQTVELAVDAAAADVVLTQLEIPEPCVEAALRSAKAAGRTSILNPAPMTDVRREVLSLSSWLIPNGPEVQAIARMFGIAGELPYAELAQRCGTALETDIVVTLGADGALVYRNGSSNVTRVPAPQAEPVDTTGAGDAFVGAFAYALALESSAEEAAAFGCACASASVEARGTQTSFPRGSRLEEIRGSLSVLTGSTR